MKQESKPGTGKMDRIISGDKGLAPMPFNNGIPETSGDNKGIKPPSQGIEIIKRDMRKLKPEEISALELPKLESPLITSAIKTKPDGSREITYLLATSEGSVFELSDDSAMLQELRIAAGSAALDAFEAMTPIQTAAAIKKAIGAYGGLEFKGSPFEAWDFAIKGMEKMRAFQVLQTELIQINTLQGALRNLLADQNLPLAKWVLLPGHRREAAMLLTETALVSVMEKYITQDTVQAASNFKDVSIALKQRRTELAKLTVESFRDIALGVVDESGKTAINLLGQLLIKGGEGVDILSKALIGVIFGSELADEGVIKATLDRSGDLGKKILQLWEASGLSLNQFLQNLFKDTGKLLPTKK